LGECLIAQDKFLEAEPLIVRNYESLKKSEGAYPYTAGSGKVDPYEKWRTLAAKRAVELYEKWQKPDLAAKYRATP
jgi:hypothetical protein